MRATVGARVGVEMGLGCEFGLGLGIGSRHLLGEVDVAAGDLRRDVLQLIAAEEIGLLACSEG